MAISKSVQAILSAKDQGFSSTFKNANSLLGIFSGGQTKATKSNGGFLNSVKSTAVGMGVYRIAAKAMSIAQGSVNSAMGRSDTLYLYRRNVTQLTGSASKAETALNQLSDSTTGTAYGLDTVANATQTFANSNIELKKSGEYSTRFMDLISRYGDGTNATYERVMLQMGQMSSKQKANLGDIKSAVEANIPVWSILAKETGKSVGEIQESITAGEWTAEEFFDTLMRGSNDAAGAAKDGANTWAGAIGIMKSRMTIGMTSILESFKKVGAELSGEDNGIFLGLLKIGDVAKVGMQNVAKAIEGSVPYINILRSAFEEVVPPITSAISAVLSNVGFLNQGFNKVGAIQTFKGMVDGTKNSLITFANFVERNSEAIGKFIGYMPQAVTAIASLKVISSVGQAFSRFGFNITNDVMGGLERLEQANELVTEKFVDPIRNNITKLGSGVKSGISAMISTAQVQGLVFKDTFQKVFASAFSGNNGPVKFFVSMRTAMNETFPSFAKFDGALTKTGSLFRHPLTGLKDMQIGLRNFSVSAGGSGTAINGFAMGVGNGFKKMATMGIGAIRSLGMAMLSNPVTAILMAIAGAVVFVAASWKNNFMNIQGVMSSFGSGLKNSFASMKSMFKGLEPIVQGTGKVFVGLGKVLTGTVLVAVGAVVDVFRGLVFGVTTLMKAVQALSFGMSGLWKKIKGDSDGADESFDKMKQSVDSIGESFNNLKNNSSTVAAVKSLNEFGKASEEVSKNYQIDVESMKSSADELSNRLSEASSNMEQSFDVEGASKKLTGYVSSSMQILERFNSDKLKTTEKYSELMQQAEQAEGDEKQAILNSANEAILSDITKNNSSMVSLYKETTDQLISGKNIEGGKLTAEQRKSLEAQNEVIRAGLMEQNELFVQASMQKVASGQRLNQQEQKAAESNLKALYSNQTEQIQSNESKISELRKQYNEAKQQSQKDNLQAEIDGLKSNNETMLLEQQGYGEKQMELMLNGNEMTSQAVLDGLQSRQDITGEKLGEIFQYYVDSNTSIDDQMALLGGILEQRGFEGADKLGIALKSGDLAALGGELTSEMETGIAGLPDSMFWKGDIGKNRFIAALKSGDYAGAAGFMTSSVDGGLAKGAPKAGQQGKNTVSEYNKNVEGQKGAAGQAGSSVSNTTVEGLKKNEAKATESGKTMGQNHSKGIDTQKGTATRSGASLSNSSITGMKQNEGKGREAGSTLGRMYVAGLSSQNGAANHAGMSLTNQALAGARANVGQAQSIGLNLAAGIASGIRAGTPDAVASMASLVKKVNIEAEKKAEINSPSKVTTRFGQFIAAGFPKGWNNELPRVLSSVGGFVEKMNQAFYGGLDQDLQVGSSFEMNLGKSSQTTQSNPIVNAIASLKETVENLRMQIYLDTGQLIGTTDEGLADTGERENRRKF
ncbi:MAG: tape measure protein [Vagococcus salmoninarum]|uniref:tape measure protein n=1 Tax=Vagococcus salmoninarum TaxID=2739 RepID=UPI003F982BFC